MTNTASDVRPTADHTCPPWATKCRTDEDGVTTHGRRPENGAAVEVLHVAGDEHPPSIYVGSVGSGEDYSPKEAKALGAALIELVDAVLRPPVLHPIWCASARPAKDWGYNDDGAGYNFLAPPEADEVHRARAYHLESGDVTLTLGLIQNYEISSVRGPALYVAPAGIDFAMVNHGLEDANADTELSLVEAKALRAFLDRVIGDLEQPDHLPVID